MEGLKYPTLLLLFVTANTCTIKASKFFDGVCHNYYGKENCIPKTYHIFKTIECNLCKIPNKDTLLTMCHTKEFNITEADIIQNLPVNTTEELIISYDNVWNGYLPLQPQPIDLTKLGRLVNLKYFQISDDNYNYFQLYPIKFNLTAMSILKVLTRLRIRIPVIDADPTKPSIADVLKHMPQLELLDLSYTRGLGRRNIIEIMSSVNNSKIKQICLRRFQLPGGYNYTSDFKHVTKNLKSNIYPNLIELDLSDNALCRISPVVHQLAPNLKKLDISGNILVDVTNIALLMELLLHPSIEELNLGYQGSAIYNPDPFHNSNTTNSIDYGYDKDGGIHELYSNQLIFELKCVGKVVAESENQNISQFQSDSTMFCEFLKCILPTLMQELNCTSQTFLIPFGDMYDPKCMLHIQIPIGENLKRISFSNVHFEQAQTVGFSFIGNGGLLCLNASKLETLSFDGNRLWMDAAQIGKISAKMAGVTGLDALKNLNLSNNGINSDNINEHSKSSFVGKLPSLNTLDISSNYLQSFKEVLNASICLFMPKVKILYLGNGNMTAISKELLNDCLELEHLELRDNRIDINTLDHLDFTNTPKIRYLGLAGNNILSLNDQTMQNLKNMTKLKVDLSDNPLSCNCTESSQQFTTWLIETHTIDGEKFIDFNSYQCQSDNGKSLVTNLDLSVYLKNCVTKSYSLATLIASIATTLGCTVLFASLIGLYKIRWRIRYNIFRIQQICAYMLCSIRKSRQRERTFWRYDAFISYCAGDRFWVHSTLMKTLEIKYGFRLCIHYRDFPVGGDIAETISERMAQSREIIIVLSDIALMSEWCSFELDEALRQIHRRKMNMIVIKLGRMKTKLLNSKLAHVLDTQTFLEWSDNSKRHKLFWATLVGKLYNNSHGGCTCCCPYGAKALQYQDIIDPQDDEVDEELEYEEGNLPDDAKGPHKVANDAKLKLEKALQFKNTLQQVLIDEEELPQWAFGPIPWPIEQILTPKKEEIDDLAYKHAHERVNLLIQCLSKFEEEHRSVYEDNKAKVMQIQNSVQNN